MIYRWVHEQHEKNCSKTWIKRTLPIECFHMTSRRPYWCPKTMKRRPCWCYKPVLWELNSFLMQSLSFVPINLHRCWPREWKHSISRRQWSLSFISFLHKSLFLVIMWAVVRFKKVSAWYRFKNTLTAVIASTACQMASFQSDQSSPKWTLNHHLCWNHWSGLLRTWMEQPGVVVAAV